MDKLPFENWSGRASFSVDWRKNFFSVYVGNIHWKTSLGTLWTSFSKFGSVSDIFIPSKAEKLAQFKGIKYCFVRFRKEAEALKALAASVVLLGKKLVIKEASEQSVIAKRGPLSNEADNRKSKSFKEALLSNVQQKPVDAEDIINDPSSNRGGFVSEDNDDVILSPKKQSHVPYEKGLVLDIPSEEMEWLERSAVGRIRYNADFSDSLSYIYEGLAQQGIFASVAKFSNSQAILTFADKEEMELLLRNHFSLFQIWFEELATYCSKHWCRASRCWVKIDNLPLSLWNVSFFRYFGELWGNLIQVAEVSSKRLQMDSAWIQLEVPLGVLIPVAFKEVINDIHLNLKISLVSENSIPKPFSYNSASSDSSDHSVKDSPAFILHKWVEERESDEQLVDIGREEAVLGAFEDFNCGGVKGSDSKLNSSADLEVNAEACPDSVCGDRQIVIWAGKMVENLETISDESDCTQPPTSHSFGSELEELVVDLSHFEAKDCEPSNDSPFMLNRGLDKSRGFGGFNRGFLQNCSKHNWSWIKKPRSRLSALKPSLVEGANMSRGPQVEIESNSFENLRQEAVKTLEVGKSLGMSFKLDDEQVIRALMEDEMELLKEMHD